MSNHRLLTTHTDRQLQVPPSDAIAGHLAAAARLNVLLICNYEPHQAATVQDHIRALKNYSAHNVLVYSGLGELPHNLALHRFDAIICHYSVTVASDAYLGPLTSFNLRTYRGLKALFVQDEYRHVDATIDAIEYLGINVLFTCVPEQEWEKVYPKSRLPTLELVNVLTGYVPEQLTSLMVPQTADRPIDVGYRGRRYPAWHGELGRQRVTIAERFEPVAVASGLVCDIAVDERARLYGQDWIQFLTRCKAVLGTESGSSVFDFTGTISRAVQNHCARDSSVTYDELRNLYFRDGESSIRLNQISSRCFEAIALRTLLVLYEGEYSGILIPEKHYVPLRKDHSNAMDVITIIKDARKISEIIGCAYSEIALDSKLSYRSFVHRIDIKLSQAAARCGRAKSPYAEEEFVAAFGHFSTPFRAHLIKSRIVVSAAMLAKERIFPLLGQKGAAAAKSWTHTAINCLRDCRQRWKYWKLASTAGSRQLMRSARSAAERNELGKLHSRCRAAAAIAATIGRPILAVRLEQSEALITITPDPDRIDVDATTDLLEFSNALRRSRPTQLLWMPGPQPGLCRLLRACRPERFDQVANLLSNRPELLALLFRPSSTIFHVNAFTTDEVN